MINRIVVMIIYCALVIGGFICIYSPTQIDAHENNLVKKDDMEKLDVELSNIVRNSNTLDMELHIRNKDSRPIFVMQNPIRIDGSSGYYLSLANDDPSTLEISSALYPLPKYFIYTDDAAVQLRSLNSGESCIFHLSFPLPLEKTTPPYGDQLQRYNIPLNNVRFVKVTIGTLPDDEGVRAILRRVLDKSYVSGLEPLTNGMFKGKRLIDIQTIHQSKKVKLT